MKKKLLIPAAVLLGIVLLVICGTLFFLSARGLAPHTGIYLEADNGSHLIVLDGRSPIVMSNHTGDEAAFSRLETGDKVFVLLDGIDESYPGASGAYLVLRIGRDRLDQVSQETLDTLAQLGWITR